MDAVQLRVRDKITEESGKLIIPKATDLKRMGHFGRRQMQGNGELSLVTCSTRPI
jgi:hypothetical protein